MSNETVWETREEAVKAFYEFRQSCDPINQATRYGQQGDVALYQAMQQVQADLQEAILTQFGKWDPRHPACTQCRWASVFGGPGHEGSSYCRSGKRPHCTCDACF